MIQCLYTDLVATQTGGPSTPGGQWKFISGATNNFKLSCTGPGGPFNPTGPLAGGTLLCSPGVHNPCIDFTGVPSGTYVFEYVLPTGFCYGGGNPTMTYTFSAKPTIMIGCTVQTCIDSIEFEGIVYIEDAVDCGSPDPNCGVSVASCGIDVGDSNGRTLKASTKIRVNSSCYGAGPWTTISCCGGATRNEYLTPGLVIGTSNGFVESFSFSVDNGTGTVTTYTDIDISPTSTAAANLGLGGNPGPLTFQIATSTATIQTNIRNVILEAMKLQDATIGNGDACRQGLAVSVTSTGSGAGRLFNVSIRMDNKQIGTGGCKWAGIADGQQFKWRNSTGGLLQTSAGALTGYSSGSGNGACTAQGSAQKFCALGTKLGSATLSNFVDLAATNFNRIVAGAGGSVVPLGDGANDPETTHYYTLTASSNCPSPQWTWSTGATGASIIVCTVGTAPGCVSVAVNCLSNGCTNCARQNYGNGLCGTTTVGFNCSNVAC